MRGHGARNGIPLTQLTAHLQQQMAMRLGLDAFGDDPALEGCRQADHPLQNGQVIRIIKHVAHKALVYLEQTDTQMFEVTQ